MKKIAILGSTGSVGRTTVAVAHNLEEVNVVALAAGSNIDRVEEQARQLTPQLIAIHDEKAAHRLQQRLPEIEVVAGDAGLVAAATLTDVDTVVSAIVGTQGLLPTLAALEAGKDVALANKEALVAGGEVVMATARKSGATIIPVDSEHSAIYQCLKGEELDMVERLILTASGGPFRNHTADQLATITVDDALRHPTWSMGPKITVDSSTLMNKGLEVIEAHMLFGIAVDAIDVVIHPQSIIHSMVEYVDGSVIAQMSHPSMALPIQYALTHPQRSRSSIQPLKLWEVGALEFFAPNTQAFCCLQRAYDALNVGGSMPCYMNAANETLVDHFLNRKIPWSAIGHTLTDLMERHTPTPVHDLDTILAIDAQARSDAAATLICK